MPSLLRNIRLGGKRASLGEGGTNMESVIFEVVTKAGMLLIGLSAFAWWLNAGMPFVTISRK
jgi:hypothetical protein